VAVLSLAGLAGPPEEDFGYYTVYGSDSDVFDSTAVLIDYTTATMYDVSASPHPYYYVTTSDHAGNGSGAAGLVDPAVDVPSVSVAPLAFAFHAARPNPFLHLRQIRRGLVVSLGD
jgi:hypothetical protein